LAASISETIKKLSDSDIAKIDIPTVTGQTIRLNCIYKESDSPSFFLVFPPKKLPENIDIDQPCLVSINTGQTTLTLSAKITNIKGDRTLELTAQSRVKPENLREYFRVDTKVFINASFDPESSSSRYRPWSFDGETLDISGSGVLAIFPGEPQNKHQINLFIDVRGDQKYIECLGHIVRIKRLRRGKYQISFHFDHISPKDKDSLISYCLKEQRNRLREKIQTID
jgi:hypothetical protein